MSQSTRLGLKQNWKQFSILVIVNAFVGGMVGMERTILPELAEAGFGIAANTAILSFIVFFGISKALTNYFTGALATKWGRKNLLILGWIFGLPVPFLLIYAPNWNWVIFANILLGINQGLAWSSTVIMKIDLVGEKDRGLAMGLNESAGYLAVGLAAFFTGWLGAEYGLRPYPFYTGIGFAAAGLLASVFLVKDTRAHVKIESGQSEQKKVEGLFWRATWKDRNLGSISQAGLVNNLNDGMVWGLFPVLLASKGFDLEHIGFLVAIYPTVWGLGQLFTGKMADHFKKKKLLFLGMLLQGLAILAFLITNAPAWYTALFVLLGIGTAVVYPTFLAAIADYSHPDQRPKTIGIFRLWRDLGYAIGALLSGVVADVFGLEYSIFLIGALTIISGLIIRVRMD